MPRHLYGFKGRPEEGHSSQKGLDQWEEGAPTFTEVSINVPIQLARIPTIHQDSRNSRGQEEMLHYSVSFS